MSGKISTLLYPLEEFVEDSYYPFLKYFVEFMGEWGLLESFL